jgi:hypothetical protein
MSLISTYPSLYMVVLSLLELNTFINILDIE